jgi:4-aminobutyrate aminotransferase-like enzyme/Ser/Thr protein kinase RdoA (MazF antagonist)
VALLDGVPGFDPEAAERLARELFGFDGRAVSLPSERDQNFRLRDAHGQTRVLKISNAQDPVSAVAVQTQLVDRVCAAVGGGLCARTMPARDGSMAVLVDGAGGQRHVVRLVEYLEGVTISALDVVPARLRVDWGRRVAQVDRALAGFDAPFLHRPFVWRLETAVEEIERRRAWIDADLLPVVDALLAEFVRCTVPCLPALRLGAIHNDANDHNVLVSPDHGGITGILDFGDVVHGYLVADLAVAAAYAVLSQPEPLDALADVVAGYASVLPLEPAEQDAVYGLVCLRLCLSAAMAAENRRARPDDPYLLVSQAPIAEVLPKLAERPFELGAAVVRAACDPATPHEPREPEDDPARLRKLHVGPSVRLSYEQPIHVARGFRQFLFAADGRRYLDAYNNVPHVGHGHPDVVAAAVRQQRRLATNTRYHYRALGLYAERLAATLPDGLDVCFFVSSGSEANELALRLARAATGVGDVVVLDGAYHGHTTGMIDVSPYKHAGPGGVGAPSWVHVVEQPDLYRGRFRADHAEAGRHYAADVASKLAGLADGGRRVGAFLAESCPSVGGQHVLPDGYLVDVYAAMRRQGGICIADEVQTGFGRMGDAFYAFEAQGVVPDVVVLGKPIGNGHPLAAVVTTRAIAEAFDNGMEFFATFGGGPVACEVGLAVLDVVEREQLMSHAARVGSHLLAGFAELAARHPAIGDVRGRGLFLGVELVEDRASQRPATSLARRIKNRLREGGILIGTDGLADNVLKVRPPMPFSVADADRLLAAIDDALAAGQP